MAINQVRVGSDIANLASNITGTILKNRSAESIAEQDRLSRETIEANRLSVEENLKRLGLDYDVLITKLNNASNEQIAQFRTAADKYIAWLKEMGLSTRLDSQLSHDKWVTAYQADQSYFNNLIQAMIPLIGKTNFTNMGFQNLIGSTFIDELNKLRTINGADFLKGVKIDGKENLNTKGMSKGLLWPQKEKQTDEGQAMGFNDEQRLKRQGGKGWTF